MTKVVLQFLRPLLLTMVILVLVQSGVQANPVLPPGEPATADAFTRLADAGTAEDHSHADHVIVLSTTLNKVKPSGVTYVDGYDLVKILTPAGCRNQSVLNWRFDPQSSHVEVREVYILRDDERLPVDVSLVQDLPAPQAAIYWRDRIKILQLPRLEVGDGIEVITYRKGFTYALLTNGHGSTGGSEAPDDDRYIPPMPGEYFDIVLFSENAPIIEKRYTLRLPADKRLHAEVYNGALYSSVTYDDQTTEYAWWGLDLPAQVHETSQPASNDFVPKVVMATAQSWEAKSSWFFDVNRNQFDVTPAIQMKVDEILKDAGLGKADEESRAKALLHWVAQNIRYSGQTMGEGEGFTLHSADMIFNQRSGVCKDIAGMLVTMMRAAGMDSYAAMTMAGSRIDDVPADQFNHCVTALRLEDGTFRMYDPTWAPFNNDIWSMLETEQHYLVGTPEGESLSRIRYSTPQESPLKVVHEAKLDAEGTLVGTFRLEGSGALDGRLRRIVSGTRIKEIDNRFARLLSSIGNRVEEVSVEHHSPADFSEDMWIKFSYRIPGFAMKLDGGLEFTSPAMNMVLNDGSLFRTGLTQWPEDRTTDILLYYTQQVDLRETIRLPRGMKLEELDSVPDIDETYAGFNGSVVQDGRDLEITSLTEVRRRQIPPDGYAGFREAISAAQQWGKMTIRVAKEAK